MLDALRSAGGEAVSGEVIGHALGVSRVAVSKHVAALRALGYDIEAHTGAGYRLLTAPGLALPGEVAPLVHDPFWQRVEGGPHTGSTNDDARELARDGAPEGTVVVAAAQDAGRGRLGRSWESPEGGAYFSTILRPRVAPAQVGSLSLAVSLGAAQGLEVLGVHAQLKWPNDLLLGEGKLAGILLEMSAESDAVDWVVAGVGVNVVRPATPLAGAAYANDAAPGVSPAAVVAAALDGIAVGYAKWASAGFGPLRADYQAHLAITGREVEVRDRNGTLLTAGRVTGVDDSGLLLLKTAEGIESVVAGEVTLRR